MKINELKEVLYSYNLKDTEDFIDRYFYNNKPFEEIQKNLEIINDLPKSTLIYGVNRLSSFEHYCDPGRHISIIGASALALIAFYITSFTNSDAPFILKLLLGVIIYGGFFIFVALELGKLNKRKEKITYFKGLLNDTLKKKLS